MSDNDVGIGASALPDVFEPFFTTKGAGAKAAAPRGVKLYLPKYTGKPISRREAPTAGGDETVLVV